MMSHPFRQPARARFGPDEHEERRRRDGLSSRRRFAPRVSYASTGPTGFIQRDFDVMVETPRHTYQLLTKRPIRLARMADQLPWPSNVWVGASIEHRAEAGRADRLREVPAAVRFISAELHFGPLEVDWAGSTRVTTAVSPSLPATRSPCQWPDTARPGDRVGRVGQADREPAVSSSELSTSSP